MDWRKPPEIIPRRTAERDQFLTPYPPPPSPIARLSEWLRAAFRNQGVFGLCQFVRDVCDGDIIAWITRRLTEADPNAEVAIILLASG